MAVQITAGSGTNIATELVSTTHYQQIKLIDSTIGSTSPTGVAANPLQVSLANTGANATALKVDNSAVTQPISVASLPLPTGAAISAKQPALGTAGSASTDVITVQGIASMTALKVDGSAVTQPVNGTITANAGTNLNTSALALESGGNLASVKTNTDNLNLAQASTTSGQKGNLIMGAVTTSAPTYTTAQTNPLSLQTDGSLRTSVTNTVTVGTHAVTQSGSWNVGVNAGTNYMGKVRITDGTNDTTLRSLTNSKSLDVSIVDGSGNQITSFGGGTQYATGAAQATPTGTVALGWDGTNVKALPLDTSGFLKVNVAAGGGSGGTSSSFAAAFPATGTAIGVDDGAGNMGKLTLGSQLTSNALAVAIASDQTVGINGAVTTDVPALVATGNSGTLGSLNSSISINTNGLASAIIELSGTWVGTVTFQYTQDGTNWGTMTVNTLSGNTAATTTTTNGSWLANVEAFYSIRGIMTSYTSGTATIRIRGHLGSSTSRITAPLPAGTNAIGSITNTSFAATQSGTWNITNISGSVSLPTGAATAAKQPALGTAGSASTDVITVQGITSMTPLKVDGSGVTQPVSGTVTANIGTSGSLALDATLTGGTQQTKITDGTNTVAVKAASTAATATDKALVVAVSPNNTVPVSLASVPTHAVTQSGTWTVQPGNTSNTTPWLTSLRPGTSGGLSTYHLVSGATTNATNIKASAGQVFGWYIYNSNAAARKLVFHNASGTPTAGASVFFSIVIPPSSGANVFSDVGIAFSIGIAITTVTGLADSDTTAVAANDLIINIFYA